MLSAFEIIGPPMVGPSSSHTAGACRIGLMARLLLGQTPQQGRIGLHGSFAATGKGHATDRALVAGLLGFAPDDERLKEALNLAPGAGLQVEFESVDLGEEMHPNTARLELTGQSESVSVIGSSVGGGAIMVARIDGFEADLSGRLESLVIWHRDSPGLLGGLALVCAFAGINIATARTSRHERGEEALTALEIDGRFDADVISVVGRHEGIRRLALLPALPGLG